MMEIIFQLLLIFFPPLLYALLFWTYKHSLDRSFNACKAMFVNNQRLTKYYFDKDTFKDEEILSSLKRRFFLKRHFILPILISMAVVLFGTLIIYIHLGFDIKSLPDFVSHFKGVRSEIIFAFTGAYLWSLSDILIRMRNANLNPNAIHFTWIRIIVATLLGYIISTTSLSDTLKLFFSFIVGIIPLISMKKNLIKIGIENSKLNLTLFKRDSSFPSLEGLSGDLVQRFEEESIFSNSGLAFADPIHLHFRTNIGWQRLLDLIDQAILFSYINDKIPLLRKYSIRGAIEAVNFYEEITDQNIDRNKRERLNTTLEEISKLLEMHPDNVLTLFESMSVDDHVKFIHMLWETTVSLNKEKYRIKEEEE